MTLTLRGIFCSSDTENIRELVGVGFKVDKRAK
jgi:hypothetical protein